VVAEEALARYLEELLERPVERLAVRALAGAGELAEGDQKKFGYGVPLEVECMVGGQPRRFVVSRTRPAQGFGHDYPADRAWQALYGHEAYNSFPRHVRSVDVAFARESGELVSAADATEFFQLVEKAPGQLYWLDLDRLLSHPLEARDTARARLLGQFLAQCHADKREEPTLYERRIRELVGHGECVMGILDSYPHPYRLFPPADCERFEREMVGWRWRLRQRAHRLARVHGDFHPWNLLFGEGADFSILDRSRGEWGEPADDVSALGVNYLFFGVRKGDADGSGCLSEPFATLFHVFLDSYLEASRDRELLEVLPPFFAFRALVIAHPRWYPDLTDATRRSLLGFARAMVASRAFAPGHVESLLRGAS
jgi:hypothetical protein